MCACVFSGLRWWIVFRWLCYQLNRLQCPNESGQLRATAKEYSAASLAAALHIYWSILSTVASRSCSHSFPEYLFSSVSKSVALLPIFQIWKLSGRTFGASMWRRGHEKCTRRQALTMLFAVDAKSRSRTRIAPRCWVGHLLGSVQ